MTDRFFPDKQIQNARVARPVSGRVIVWLTVIAIAGALVSGGFVISAGQHFQAVQLGYRSEELRREATELDEKLRQLELQYARARSPVEIEKRAQKIGLERPKPKAKDEKAKEAKAKAAKAKTIRRPSAKR
jgi:septal ring factor EnvC (AmiA/AmiB activator)